VVRGKIADGLRHAGFRQMALASPPPIHRSPVTIMV
jgi:hypothetical protein